MTSRDRRLEKARMLVLFNVPFFAIDVAKMTVQFISRNECAAIFGPAKLMPDGNFSTEHWTACTDGKVIKWCGSWFDSLPDSVLPTVLCHEVCHCLFGHLWRSPTGVDWDLWNQATDHAVNLMLKEFSQQITVKGLADPFPFPQPETAYCADPAFAGMCEEAIYAALSNRPKNQQGQQQKQAGQGGGQSQPKPHSMPDFGQMEQPQNVGSPEQVEAKSSWQATLLQSAAVAKQRGELPGSLSKLVDSVISPSVPWFELLRAWLREQAADDWDLLKPNLTFDGSGFILPSLNSEKIGSVVFATDTSGSTSEFWSAFQAEKQDCLDQIKPSKLVDIYCDSSIQEVREYSPGEQVDLNVPGGGGTDFRPVFRHVDTMAIQPKCLVYLTDLDGTFPDEAPSYPVLWVLTERGKQAPFGETIYAGE